ncbi:hypothetical protein MMAG44476_38275 [Mycolicibacterium mageritense DSM 44476 = CIP 104973]|uniref:Intersectin-EH binding protein Ibp1 n=1 Tax=Mycolicibacterium mageritense TaxID=53462 RepID=A0AAI8XNT8_MYCME|nr:hypothetical protein [Mycolicibacterium mageritense]MBN3454586.1 hypothetical protein [Mycobacterium sp. DSM 3803]MCC9185389.1 hypothetical protein [Mycolicibacterium mageritense]TXI65095.1 MAG: hypothetical protein E6Q55_03175 [Mycolicibacterium mageritense]CDO26100.1 hypothetical protein BN978_06650 [Mycolicibacterium mageritense DSM 44476 = CIP 104973]BBX37230.1 hypothetical protein MMAGJ_65120 [Mycolicibacterium mageritense]
MSHPVRRVLVTVLSATALAAAPMGVVTVVTPAVSSACLPGETGVTNGCSPFCLPGRQLDTATGLCLPAPPPASPNDVVIPPR